MDRRNFLQRSALAFSSYRWLLRSAVLCSAVPAIATDLTGQVQGPDGKPVAGARVVIEDLLRGDTTSPTGAFRLPNLPAGEYDLSVSAMGLAGVNQHITIPSEGAIETAVKLRRNEALLRAAAMNAEPPTEHLAQKQEYLASLRLTARRTPNVLIVLFDDLGYGDLSSYGNRLIRTPNIDALAGKGMRLEQCYSGSPVCTPSRAALLTGRYPTRSHAANHVFFPSDNPMALIRRSAGYANALPADEILLPEVLARAGYATGAFGKWHLGDTPGHRPTDLGFQRYFGVLYSNDMNPLAIYRDANVDTPPEKTDQSTLTERFTDAAIGFIRANANKPFFAYVPYTAPHLPHFANPKHRNVSAGGTYGDVIEDLDANVGRLMRTLDELKVADNTIVIVTSDNGGDWGGSAGDLRGRKGETFEGGMRVPAFVIWPGRTKPRSSSQEMMMNIDIFPTLLAELGIALPRDRVIDGKDVRPILSGGKTPHDYLYYVTTWSAEYQAVRDRDFKFRDVVAGKSPLNPAGGREFYAAKPVLYDLSRDNESHDVTAKHPDEAARLKRQLDSFRSELQKNPRGWVDSSKEKTS